MVILFCSVSLANIRLKENFLFNCNLGHSLSFVMWK